MMKIKMLAIATSAAMLMLANQAQAASGDTLAQVKKKGELQCGVSDGLPGFSNPNAKGTWEGIDVEFCRALAAGIFGALTASRKILYIQALPALLALVAVLTQA